MGISFTAGGLWDFKGCKKGLSPLTFAAIEGMILVRNYASRKYFGISYEELYFRGSREIKSNDKSRLEAIDKLFPLKIFDLNYAKLNSMETGYVTPVPEVIPAPDVPLTYSFSSN